METRTFELTRRQAIGIAFAINDTEHVGQHFVGEDMAAVADACMAATTAGSGDTVEATVSGRQIAALKSMAAIVTAEGTFARRANWSDVREALRAAKRAEAEAPVDPEPNDLPHCTCGMTVDACVCEHLDTPDGGVFLSPPADDYHAELDPTFRSIAIEHLDDTYVDDALAYQEAHLHEKLPAQQIRFGFEIRNLRRIQEWQRALRAHSAPLPETVKEIDEELAWLNFRLIDITGAKYARAIDRIDQLSSLKAHARAVAGLPEHDEPMDTRCAPDCCFCGGQGCPAY